jgi:glutamate-1-semialdehyde 2,1-aminomutase
LKLIQAPGFFDRLAATTSRLVEQLQVAAKVAGVRFSAQSVGGMFGVYFRPTAPETYAQVLESDRAAFNRFFHALLQQGVYFTPSAYEAGFVSAAHGDAEIAATVEAAKFAFGKIAAS